MSFMNMFLSFLFSYCFLVKDQRQVLNIVIITFVVSCSPDGLFSPMINELISKEKTFFDLFFLHNYCFDLFLFFVYLQIT